MTSLRPKYSSTRGDEIEEFDDVDEEMDRITEKKESPPIEEQRNMTTSEQKKSVLSVPLVKREGRRTIRRRRRKTELSNLFRDSGLAGMFDDVGQW